jgi:hypothetical protein
MPFLTGRSQVTGACARDIKLPCSQGGTLLGRLGLGPGAARYFGFNANNGV